MSEGRRAYGRGPGNRQPACTTARRILAALDMSKADQDKAERLAAALRENLRKRKAQAREAQPKKDPTQPAKE
jgi:hypothetical protein